VTIQAQVLLKIRDLRDRLGTALIMITHDLGIVAQTCDNVAVMYAGELVETGTARDIFSEGAHHPYTVGLFDSIPRLDRKSRRLKPIPGLMPDPTNLPAGCFFSPRCPKAAPVCQERRPPPKLKGAQAIRCHLFGPGQGFSGAPEARS
jgi:peptide/nickel transport system ATP-binding protein